MTERMISWIRPWQSIINGQEVVVIDGYLHIIDMMIKGETLKYKDEHTTIAFLFLSHMGVGQKRVPKIDPW